MKKKKAFSKLVSLLTVLVILIILFSVGFALLINNSTIKRSIQLSDSYTQDVEMRALIDVITTNSEKALIMMDKAAYQRVVDSAESLLLKLSSLKTDFTRNGDGLFYYRTLYNMTEAYLSKIGSSSNRVTHYFEYYDPQEGIKARETFLKKQYNSFSLAYLNNQRNLYSTQIQKAKMLSSLSVFIIFLILSGMVAIYVVNSRRMLSDMKNISQHALCLSNGDWEIDDIHASSYYEINNIIIALNKMRQNIIKSMEDLEQKALLERNYTDERIKSMKKDQMIVQAQLKALQMQINPHFLFNTLNQISRTALLNDTQSTIELVEAISDIMRYSIGDGTQTATLQAELEALESYIKIQRVRYHGIIKFETDISNNIDFSSIIIPPLILQPFVENAIIHGVGGMTTGGVIRIILYKEKDKVIIRISDNGKGMTQDELDAIYTGNQVHSKTDGAGIGVHNVLRRLEYYLGDGDTVTFISGKGMGTEVVLRLPLGD